MDQETLSRQLVVVVGPSAVDASLGLLLRPMGLGVEGWHVGLDRGSGAATPRVVVAHFPPDVSEAASALRAIRSAFPETPVLALSDGSEPSVARALLEGGVSRHFAFPADEAELRAHLGDIVGRTSGFWSLSASEVGFSLEEGGFVVRIKDVEAHLTKSEFSIMAYLVCQRDQWITAQDLLRDVLGPNHAAGTSLVRVHMHNIRRKLGSMAGAIQVVRGKGYRLVLLGRDFACEMPALMGSDLKSA